MKKPKKQKPLWRVTLSIVQNETGEVRYEHALPSCILPIAISCIERIGTFAQAELIRAEKSYLERDLDKRCVWHGDDCKTYSICLGRMRHGRES